MTAFKANKKTFTIGKYPDTSLSEARTSKDEAKKLASVGIDSPQQKQIAKRQIDEDSFKAIAENWLDKNKSNWSKSYYKSANGYLNNDVYPILGNRILLRSKHLTLSQ